MRTDPTTASARTVGDVVAHLRDLGLADATAAARLLEDPRPVRGAAPDAAAAPSDLAWISPRVLRDDPDRPRRFRGALLIAPLDDAARALQAEGVPVLPCRSPKLALTRAVEGCLPELLRTAWPEAGQRAPGVEVGRDVSLAPGVVLGSNTVLGDGVVVGPNTCIANAVVAPGVRIGANCSIGLPGFGYERDESGEYFRFPHVGRVVIAEGVEIGSNTCVDRGALGDTRIGPRCKIDNLVHIAHNVQLGADVLVIAHSMIAGSVTVGDGAWIAPSAAVLNQVSVGAGATVGLGAVVIRPVPDGATVVGNPAKPLAR